MSMNDESSELFTSLIKSSKSLVSQLSMCDKEEYDAFIVAVGDAIANLLASESNTNNRLHQSALENLPFIIENFDDTFNNLIVIHTHSVDSCLDCRIWIVVSWMRLKQFAILLLMASSKPDCSIDLVSCKLNLSAPSMSVQYYQLARNQQHLKQP